METKIIELAMLDLKELTLKPIICTSEMHKIEVALTELTHQCDLIVLVLGEYLEPLYKLGDFLLVRYQDTLEVNDLGMICYDEDAMLLLRGEQSYDSPKAYYGSVSCDKTTEVKGKVLGKLENHEIIHIFGELPPLMMSEEEITKKFFGHLLQLNNDGEWVIQLPS